ncbi:hypothetical protein VPH5P1C_0047 [Vibrio phage 5P1c]
MNEKQILKVKVIDYEREGVHWGWWVFWLVLCWPVLIVTVWFHYTSDKTYQITVKYMDDSVEFKQVDKKELQRLQIEAKEW